MAQQRDHANVIALLWGQRGRPRRGPKPTLTLDRIVELGIWVADEVGIAELSMQRIADEAGYTKMSLYRYVSSKAELTAVMLDSALGPSPEFNRGDGWRFELKEWALRIQPVFRAHPWLMDAMVGARVLGPNELSWMEAGLNSLAGAGLSGGEKLDAISLIHEHVKSVTRQSEGGHTPERDLHAIMGELVAEHVDDYPQLTQAIVSAREPDAQDASLEFGLERILDGLGQLIALRAE